MLKKKKKEKFNVYISLFHNLSTKLRLEFKKKYKKIDNNKNFNK